MARHIRGNAKFADIDDIVTPGKERPGCDKDSAIHTTSHKQQRSAENDSDQHDGYGDKSKRSILKIVLSKHCYGLNGCIPYNSYVETPYNS